MLAEHYLAAVLEIRKTISDDFKTSLK